jgi:hypothetical protein
VNFAYIEVPVTCAGFVQIEDDSHVGVSEGSSTNGGYTVETCARQVKEWGRTQRVGCRGGFFFFEDAGHCHCATDECKGGLDRPPGAGDGQNLLVLDENGLSPHLKAERESTHNPSQCREWGFRDDLQRYDWVADEDCCARTDEGHAKCADEKDYRLVVHEKSDACSSDMSERRYFCHFAPRHGGTHVALNDDDGVRDLVWRTDLNRALHLVDSEASKLRSGSKAKLIMTEGVNGTTPVGIIPRVI